jgi:hypothetical protein
MTNREWREELAAHLAETEWVVDWSGLEQEFFMCLADVRHRITTECQGVALSWSVYRTPGIRRSEILRQLAL